MKYRLFMFVFTLCFGLATATNTCTAQPTPEGMERAQITIEGMTCSECQDKVQTALDALPDVRSVVVDWRKGSAKVLVNKGSDHEELKAAIKRAGFTVPSIDCECKG